MVRKIKFPLIMNKDVEVRTIEDLKRYFDIERVTEYFLNGKLKTWLEQRNYNNEINLIKELEDYKDKKQIPNKLCEIFDVEYKVDIDILEMKNKIKRENLLKQFTDDEKWLEKIDYIAFNQEELEQMLNNNKEKYKKCYLCGEEFKVFDKIKNITYIGVNTATLKINSNASLFDAKVNNIRFENVKITSDTNIDAKIEEYKKLNIDYEKINLKNMQDIKYCKTVTDGLRSISGSPNTLIDYMGNVHVLGNTANGEGYIPNFDAPIIDVEYQIALCVALDKNGKVYQWGNLGYDFPAVPKDLPKINQIATNYKKIVIAIDEFGKLHWWGGYGSERIFLGDYYHKENWKVMPDIKSKIVQVETHGSIVLALDEFGKVYSWGYYREYTWSQPNKIHDIPNGLPVIKKIALGMDKSVLALDENGMVHSWGEKYEGSPIIPNDLPFIVDITFFNERDIPLALDESGKVHILGGPKDSLKFYSNKIENFKNLPKLKYLYSAGGIDEFGNLYNVNRIEERLKVMIPYR
ncbi:hypothetical protein GKZ28_19845 [Clostridium chromiireducens]|uniref:Regulator of chromosome condensation (RCC1) repeat protein n=1 Tax=Clostridium chromiireducens TaxID=225345 RepID=A0A964W420_9CLOT|nr:hypothetical protein [Clostridium chromiireducens]MVX65935.1 hypothetical protein [Clostridium chromiireducens]